MPVKVCYLLVMNIFKFGMYSMHYQLGCFCLELLNYNATRPKTKQSEIINGAINYENYRDPF